MSDWHTPKPPTATELAKMQRNWIIIPEEGVIISKKTGKPLGSENADGYWNVCIGGGGYGSRLFKVHHVIWWAYYGEWPTTLLDHEDTDRGNNKIGNLRESTPSSNALNRRTQGDVGLSIPE